MRGRRLTCLVTLALLAGACTGRAGNRVLRSPFSSPTSPTPSVSPTAVSNRPPCRRPKFRKPKPQPFKESPLPPLIRQVADEVEQVRGLKFVHPVAPKAVTREKMNKLLGAGAEEALPTGEARRVESAWETIGVLPKDTNLRQAYKDFGSSSIVGFYDTDDHRLVYVGTSSPTPLQRVTLAHELTHALDDQHFHLNRLDKLNARCRDEAGLAYLSLVEGNAQVTSGLWASSNLTPGEFAQLQLESGSGGGVPSSVPPFFSQLLIFPYPNGQAFLNALRERGGSKAVDRAFRRPPVSTEQILHPAKFPDDAPEDVEVPNVAPDLGAGWKDLEFEDVGEGWLHIMLDLRIGPEQAKSATEGWDGGQYRAWRSGKHTAVILDTVWDSKKDAGQFADAMKEWIGKHVGDIVPKAPRVRVLFASDGTTLALLRRAAG